jgi:hypothetical protein
MEAVWSSETLAYSQDTTRRHNPKELHVSELPLKCPLQNKFLSIEYEYLIRPSNKPTIITITIIHNWLTN